MNPRALLYAVGVRGLKRAVRCFPEMYRVVWLFAIAVFFTLAISNRGAVARTVFQSPGSPPPVEPAAPEPTPLPAEPAPSEPTPLPAEPAPPEPTPLPPEQPEPLQEEIEPDQTEMPLNQPATEFVSPVSPMPQANNEGPTLTQSPADELRPVPLDLSEDADVGASGVRNFILDRAEFIDTVIVSTAYVWLCCGIGLFLLIPLAFLFLQIRGRGKLSQEEDY